MAGTWGDYNRGGSPGPYLKFADCNGVFITGVSPKLVYLLVSPKEETPVPSEIMPID